MPETRLTIPANHSSPIPTYYYHLKSTPSTDPITWRQHLTTSLTTLLGLQGTAITIDILKTTPSTGECIIRASGVDADRVGTAVGGGYVGGRDGVRVIKATEGWVMGLVGGEEGDLWER